jgi:hypothetical protein
MSVVLRCPNCGTTRTTPGECEACREADVRYFCTNHEPGLWLAAPACATCGARFGEAPRARPAAAPARPSRAMRPTPRAATEPPSATPHGPSVRRSTPPAAFPPSEEEAEASGVALAPWQKALLAGLRARRAGIATRSPGDTAVSLGGCLRRLLLTVVLLVIALVAALFFFGRSLMEGFQPY